MSLEEGVFVIPTGKPCWGCKRLVVERIPMEGEDFICDGWKPKMIIGRIRKIMDGCIVPREIMKTEGCYERKQSYVI